MTNKETWTFRESVNWIIDMETARATRKQYTTAHDWKILEESTFLNVICAENLVNNFFTAKTTGYKLVDHNVCTLCDKTLTSSNLM